MQRGVLGARNLNHELQRVLNPNPAATVERFGWRFSPGDRVMETQNDYDREVFNGDLGSVARIDEDEGAVIVDFDGRDYTGVTRGKRLVVLVAQRKAVGIAVRGGNMKRRWTKLREWLASAASRKAAGDVL